MADHSGCVGREGKYWRWRQWRPGWGMNVCLSAALILCASSLKRKVCKQRTRPTQCPCLCRSRRSLGDIGRTLHAHMEQARERETMRTAMLGQRECFNT